MRIDCESYKITGASPWCCNDATIFVIITVTKQRVIAYCTLCYKYKFEKLFENNKHVIEKNYELITREEYISIMIIDS